VTQRLPPPSFQAIHLPDGRLYLHEGPIDVILRAWGPDEAVREGYARVLDRFDGLLRRLVDELPALRAPVAEPRHGFAGPVARRMQAAVWPYRDRIITPMAAVAGAVADELLGALAADPRLVRAFVNDGGDIALHLTPGTRLTLGIVADVEAPRLDGTVTLAHADPVRGVATSGRGGRSFSLGVADAVTVLAGTAAAADAAATMIGNAVNLDHPAVRRLPARRLDPDSDLADLLVTVDVGELEPDAVAAALDAGVTEAEALRAAGLVEAAALWLKGSCRTVGRLPRLGGSRQG
jgi:ApbE superfamily uncharacterized protein (UPF0280 family)